MASARVQLKLRVDEVEKKVQRAAINAIDRTNAAAVIEAKRRVRVDTTNLQGSIRMVPAVVISNRILGKFGSFNVDYAIYQEIGPVFGTRTWAYSPYLRPARDAEYPRLAERIKSELQKASR